MATAPTAHSNPQMPAGAAGHVNDQGIEKALGIGRGGKRLNTHSADLQEQIEIVRDEFLEMRSVYIGRDRHDFMRNGLLGEIVSRVPIFVYDLPELKRVCNTAFVDRSGKMYISDTFARRLLSEHARGMDSLNFLIRHEADHLRRLHLARMTSFPHVIANIAQDIRINIDLSKGEAAERFYEKSSRDASDSEVKEAVKAYLAELQPTAVGIGCAMNFDDFEKFDGKSEEAIGAILMQDWKDPPQIPNRDVSFEHIMEGAAQEADNVKVMLQTAAKLPPTAQPYVMTPAELSGLASDLRKVGKAKANPKIVSDQDLQDCKDRLEKLREHQGLVELDMRHSRASMGLAGKGATHSSATTGDAYLDALRPSERVELAIAILERILNPQNSAAGDPRRGGGMSVKDLERSLGRGQGQPGQQQKQQGSDPTQAGPTDDGKGTDRDTIPAPNVYHDHDHVMDSDKLIGILKEAGVSNESLEKLGYDDLEKLEDESRHAKDGVVAAINKASEDQMKIGSRYPGGHLLHYAKAQMLDFFKPVLSWEMAFKKLLEASGRGTRFEITEPWTIYNVDAVDMGFKSQRDVPYMGSSIPGKHQKPLIICLHDTSGSVDDALLKRQISEGINMSRKVSRGNAPDVLHVFADTVGRGDPEFITERNYREVLSKGLTYGGRGGTNYQASIEGAFHMVKPGGPRKPWTGRDIHAVVYFGDCGDGTPDAMRLLTVARECGMKKLPTMLFIAPRFTFTEAFDAGWKKFGTIVYYDASPKSEAKQHINIDDAGRQQDLKMRGIESAARSARP